MSLSAAETSPTPTLIAPRELSPASVTAIPTWSPPGDLHPDHRSTDTHSARVGVDLPTDRSPVEAQRRYVGGNKGGRRTSGDQCDGAAEASEDGHKSGDVQRRPADPSEALLLILADALDDLERQRIASENRLRSLRQVKQLEGSKAEHRLAELTDALAGLERTMTLELRRAMRAHPLGPFVKRTVGLGEKQAARLIAAIGDPAWNHAENRPRRGPAELWAYCGYDPAQKRRKGVQSNWNADAKMRAFLCAESCMKQRKSPYRDVYDRERAKWADRDTSDGHKHAHALRVAAKEILKDLWREARAIGEADSKEPAPAPAEEAA